MLISNSDKNTYRAVKPLLDAGSQQNSVMEKLIYLLNLKECANFRRSRAIVGPVGLVSSCHRDRALVGINNTHYLSYVLAYSLIICTTMYSYVHMYLS